MEPELTCTHGQTAKVGLKRSNWERKLKVGTIKAHVKKYAGSRKSRRPGHRNGFAEPGWGQDLVRSDTTECAKGLGNK